MSTAGRRKSLRALARRKRANTARLAAGKNPIIGGRTVSKKTFRSKTGASTSKTAAQKRQKARK
jgi:hypothetical protein